MRRFLLIILFLLVGFSKGFCQRETDFGIAGGVAYYMGDINTSLPFMSPDINLGVIYRYNFNPRYVLKVEANYVRLRGNDLNYNNTFQQSRAASFSNSIADIAIQFEYNFLELKFDVRKIGFTPFVSGGGGYSFSLRGEQYPVIPVALGMKFSFGENWSFGLAWNHRKTFTDKIDNTENLVPDKYRSITNNNDWYSFANLFITYKIFDFRAECPAYFNNY